ncbi:MAG: hypothetical protein M1820_005413 [Bogoriella megaspora]|nr:MAG: hypothetical protein M1820_005413 [Bogoriella megaspora]
MYHPVSGLSGERRCETCQSLNPPDLEARPRGQPATIFLDCVKLKGSVKSTACRYCTLLHEALQPEYDNRELNWDDARGPLELRVELGRPLKIFDRTNAVYLEIFCETADPIFPTLGPPSYHVEEHSSSVQCHQQVKSWLKSCLETHSSCTTFNGPYLPTRIIDVGLIKGHADTFQEPVLVENSRVKANAHATCRYVALSYCWGQNPNAVKTTFANYPAHKQLIELSSLPKTIQDAILLTRYLRIPYLWVDALCIIQDDPDDWAREAGTMRSVYSSAELTISASTASASSEGIFGPQRFGTPARPLSCSGGKAKVCQNIAREHNRFEVQMCMPSPLPITRRAWTLQESVLSNRVVHYTGNELVWECNEWYRCECGLAEYQIEDDDDVTARLIRQPDLLRVSSRAGIHKKWRDLVVMYTERQLSYDVDKLVAINGIADSVARAILMKPIDRYLAGLWSDDLAHGLLWAVEDDWFRQSRDATFVYRRPKAWRAPSWSWAAVEGPVDYPPLTKLTSEIQLVAAEIEPRTQHDTTGRIISAKLILKGKMVRGVGLVAHKNTSAQKNTRRDHINGFRHQVVYKGASYDFLPDDLEQKLPGPFYACLLVGQIDWWGSTQCFFLVLELADAKLQTYKRIGVSCLGHGDVDGQSRHHFPMFDNAVLEAVTLV